jgi:flagellar biosynthesis/type III secretory pathway protein FliH
VIGPSELPRSLGPDVLQRHPAAGIVVALAHQADPVIVPVARDALRAAGRLPESEQSLYFDVLWASLSAPVLKMLEQEMQPDVLNSKSPLYRRVYRRGRLNGRIDGIEEGREEGREAGREEGREALLGAARRLLPPDRLAALEGASLEAIRTEVNEALDRLLG